MGSRGLGFQLAHPSTQVLVFGFSAHVNSFHHIAYSIGHPYKSILHLFRLLNESILDGGGPRFQLIKSSVGFIQTIIYRIQTMVYRFQTTIYRIQTMVHRFQATIYRIQTTIYRLQTTISRIQTTIYGIQTTISRVKSPVERVNASLYFLNKPEQVRYHRLSSLILLVRQFLSEIVAAHMTFYISSSAQAVKKYFSISRLDIAFG